MSSSAAYPRLIDLHESRLVEIVIRSLDRLYDGFGFVFDEALRYDRKGLNYTFLTGVTRQQLGLDPRLQPGDVDVLIVPSRDGQLLLEFSAAIEVKRLALRNGKIGRNTDRYGITQAQGLLRDGFPLVGVLHLVVSDPGDGEHIKDVDVWRVTNTDTQEIEKVGTKTADLTALRGADIQISRLFSRASSNLIGFNSLGLQQTSSDGFSYTSYFSRGRPALLNSNVSPKLLQSIRVAIESAAGRMEVRN